MADARFFDCKGPRSLGEIADASGAEIAGDAEPDRHYEDVAPLDAAGANHVSFLDNRKYVDAFRNTSAGACFVSRDHADDGPRGTALLVTPAPYLAYALAAQLFYPEIDKVPLAIDSRSNQTQQLAPDCAVAPGAVIGPGAEIGKGTRIGEGVVIGRGVILGKDCIIHPDVTITHAIIGDRVEVLPGARIGQDGFGFAPNPPGFVKVPQLGRVLIGDDVSIGANTTVDRGSGPDTVIGRDTRIDNLVQIGHNVVLGRGCVLAAQSGISGSTKVGDYVVAGGQTGMAGHLTIASGVVLAARSGVTRDLREAGQYGGFPAVPIREWRRRVAQQSRAAKNKDRKHG